MAKNVSAAKLDTINENGDTLLSGVEADAILATNFNGDISLGGATAREAEVVNESGDIMLVNMTLESALTCNSVNGDISAQRLDVVTSSVENANGDIYLSYLGDESAYRIDAHSNLGDIDAPRGGDGSVDRAIDVDSDLGDIQIELHLEIGARPPQCRDCPYIEVARVAPRRGDLPVRLHRTQVGITRVIF